jgi:hypothetical protein
MRWRKVLLLAYLSGFFSACQPTGERCQEISQQSLRNTLYEQREARFTDRLGEAVRQAEKDLSEASDTTYIEDGHTVTAKKPGYVGRDLSDAEREQIRRAVRAEIQEGDSTEPEAEPPPRPSDFRWYEEHCYQGRAR